MNQAEQAKGNQLHWSRHIPDASYEGSSSADMAQAGLQVDELWFVYWGSECIADVCVQKPTKVGVPYHLHTHVKAQYQRQGVASALYDYIEQQLALVGQHVSGSSTQTQASKAFWEKRQANTGQKKEDQKEQHRAQVHWSVLPCEPLNAYLVSGHDPAHIPSILGQSGSVLERLESQRSRMQQAAPVSKKSMGLE